MSDITPIHNLDGVQCWICIHTDNQWWVRGTILCAWYEFSHSVEEDEESEGTDDWRVQPTALVTADKSGEHWIIQLPSDDEIRFCDDALPEWTLDDEPNLAALTERSDIEDEIDRLTQVLKAFN